MSSSQAKIILLTLGEELLLGLTANTHLSYIGERLRQGGARLYANWTISDDPEEIAAQFLLCWQQADVLITTGGLGPTVDDRTKEVIGALLGEELLFDRDAMEAIARRFAELGLAVSDNNRKQAFRFGNGRPLPNANGTAPGQWLEKEGKLLIMLPGPPAELQPMFENQVLPELSRRGIIATSENYLQIRTVGIGESTLENELSSVTAQAEGLEVAFCAHHGMVDMRLSFPNQTGRQSELQELGERCRETIGHHFLCFGYATLVEVVSDLLRRHQRTLSVAESCTGGIISNAFTDLPGASEIFLGGLTTYSDAAKRDVLGVASDLIERHSAVSAEAAAAMASGAAAKLLTDFSLSTTGFIGPTGGTDQSPVGTVFVGLHSPTGTQIKRMFFKGSRATLKRRILAAAVDWLRLELLSEFSR